MSAEMRQQETEREIDTLKFVFDFYFNRQEFVPSFLLIFGLRRTHAILIFAKYIDTLSLCSTAARSSQLTITNTHKQTQTQTHTHTHIHVA